MRFKLTSSQMNFYNKNFTLDGQIWNQGVMEIFPKVYSYDEINNFIIGQKIEVAVVTPNSPFTDSIPMDYYEMPLENDAEYINYQKSIRLHIILTLSFTAGAVLLFVLAVKLHKREKLSAMEESSSTTSTKSNICSYCGGKLSDTATSCPNCGASKN